ncbi:MAG: hypothetical protein RIG77_03695 [Cyclobacteriaceae bacterium]
MTNPILQLQLPGIVRSLKTSEGQNLLCIEHVDVQSSIPHYDVFDLEKGLSVAGHISPKKNRNLVLKAITDRYIILNEYHDGQNPDKATVIVFDFERKTIVWEKENFVALEVTNGTIRAPHPHFENRFSHWDIENGLIVEEPEKTMRTTNKSEYFPLFYPDTSEHFVWFVKHIAEATGHQAVVCCEYLELTSIIVISYYFQEDQGLTNNLLILNLDGTTRELINLGKNLKGIGKDTFFAIEKKLIFISDKNMLNVYEV